MRQIAEAIQLSIDNIKSYIILGLIVVLIPSFALGQNFPQNQESENKSIEKAVPSTDGLPPYGATFKLNRPITCNDTALVRNYIETLNGMVPVTMGTDKNGLGAITSLVQLYANPLTENFAIVEHFAFLKSCIILQGHDFDIILPARYGPPKDGSKRPEQQAFKLRYTQ